MPKFRKTSKTPAPKTAAVVPAPVYADAVGTAGGEGRNLGREIQLAMEEAIKEAQKAGITDQAEIKRRIQAARQRVKDAATEEQKQKARAVSDNK